MIISCSWHYVWLSMTRSWYVDRTTAWERSSRWLARVDRPCGHRGCLVFAKRMLATARRDALIFFSYRLRIFSQALTVLFVLTLFHYISRLVRPDAVGRHGQYYAFVVVGIVSMSVLTSAVSLSVIVRMELMAGTFERVLISPLGPVGGVLSVAVFPLIYSLVLAAGMLVVGAVLFGVPVHLTGIPLALVVAGLGATALAGIGIAFAAALLAFKSALGVTWVIAGLSLIGGAYFPVSLFPGWLRWLSDVQPFTPTLDALRHLLIGTRGLEPVWLEVAKIGAFALVLVPGSCVLLWLAVNFARRRGTLMEF
jgi:ABC-2 type transport system permease protein